MLDAVLVSHSLDEADRARDRLRRVVLAVGVGGFLLFLLLGAAWYRWGAFGALLFLGGMLLLGAWIYDRRATRTYDDV